jgi:hypothetical protein
MGDDMLIASARAVAMASLIFAFQAGQATAQNVRSFVSGHGSDSNPCSLSAPCRTFQVAHNATNPKGEVVVLDSAGYGPLNITKAISIVNPGGVQAGATVTQPGAIAIAIDAGPNDTVALRGLTLEGGGNQNSVGIAFITGLRLEIVNCVARNFEIGIYIAPKNFASAYITDTISADNATAGFFISPAINQSFIGSFDHIAAINNDAGVRADSAGTLELLITDSHIDNNVTAGLQSQSSNVVLRNTTINQTPTGIELAGTSKVWLSQVTEANVPGLPIVSGVVFTNQATQHLYSDATNRLAGFSGGSPEVWFVQ